MNQISPDAIIRLTEDALFWWQIPAIQHSQWSCLPEEVLNCIFTRLTLQDVLSIRLACCNWRSAAGKIIKVLRLPLQILHAADETKSSCSALPLSSTKALSRAFPCVETIIIKSEGLNQRLRSPILANPLPCCEAAACNNIGGPPAAALLGGNIICEGVDAVTPPNDICLEHVEQASMSPLMMMDVDDITPALPNNKEAAVVDNTALPPLLPLVRSIQYLNSSSCLKSLIITTYPVHPLITTMSFDESEMKKLWKDTPQRMMGGTATTSSWNYCPNCGKHGSHAPLSMTTTTARQKYSCNVRSRSPEMESMTKSTIDTFTCCQHLTIAADGASSPSSTTGATNMSLWSGSGAPWLLCPLSNLSTLSSLELHFVAAGADDQHNHQPCCGTAIIMSTTKQQRQVGTAHQKMWSRRVAAAHQLAAGQERILQSLACLSELKLEILNLTLLKDVADFNPVERCYHDYEMLQQQAADHDGSGADAAGHDEKEVYCRLWRKGQSMKASAVENEQGGRQVVAEEGRPAVLLPSRTAGNHPSGSHVALDAQPSSSCRDVRLETGVHDSFDDHNDDDNGSSDSNDSFGGIEIDHASLEEEEISRGAQLAVNGDEAKAAGRHLLRHDCPSSVGLSCFLDVLTSSLRHLKQLSVSNCCKVSSHTLEWLCQHLPTHLERLALLKGHIQLSHGAVTSLSSLPFLEELALEQVSLVFHDHDAEDCPERVMNHLYQSLGRLTRFKSLTFRLHPHDGTHYMHSAYLLGLYEDGSVGRRSSSSSLLLIGDDEEAEEQPGSPYSWLPSGTSLDDHSMQRRGYHDDHDDQTDQLHEQDEQPDYPLTSTLSHNAVCQWHTSPHYNCQWHTSPHYNLASTSNDSLEGAAAADYSYKDLELSRQLQGNALEDIEDHEGHHEVPYNTQSLFMDDESDKTDGMMFPLRVVPHVSQRLQSLELSQVILDSDYTLMMLGCLSGLTSLKVVYRTWPLCLAQDDLSLLTTLTSLQLLHLTCVDEEKDRDSGLLALTGKSISAFSNALTRLTSFHFSGPIDLAAGDPARDQQYIGLAAWTSLIDLQLHHQPNLHAHSSLSSSSADQTCAGAAMHPLSLSLLELDVLNGLPKSLSSLSLSYVSLAPAQLFRIPTGYSSLAQLSLSQFEFEWDCMLALGSGLLLAQSTEQRRSLQLLSASTTLSRKPHSMKALSPPKSGDHSNEPLAVRPLSATACSAYNCHCNLGRNNGITVPDAHKSGHGTVADVKAAALRCLSQLNIGLRLSLPQEQATYKDCRSSEHDTNEI